MSTPPNVERRFALRMALRIPVIVSGRTEDDAAWSEPSETDDVSTTGALFHLDQSVKPGDTLNLRARHPDGQPTEAIVEVVRLAPAIYGTARVGVRVLEPNENWLRLFVAWVADKQTPAAAPTGASEEKQSSS